jgi:hypothetical protein
MSLATAIIIGLAILAGVILFALRKMGYVRAALSLYRFSFELEATDRRHDVKSAGAPR